MASGTSTGTSTTARAAAAVAGAELHARDFARVCALTYKESGIKLMAGKEGLVRSRLTKRPVAVA